MTNRSSVIEAGRWLTTARQEAGASLNLVARLATLLANRQGDPVRIHQQQLTEIENSDEERGPKSLRPWFRYVRAAFDSGLIGDATGKSTVARGADDEVFYIHDGKGDIVGQITWFARSQR